MASKHPPAEAVPWYVPLGNGSNQYRPLVSLVVVAKTGPRSVTVAFATGRPSASSTLPETAYAGFAWMRK